MASPNEIPGSNSPQMAGCHHALVQRLFVMLDKADDLLSTGDVMLDGWPAAREWHAEYEKLSAPSAAPPIPSADSGTVNPKEGDAVPWEDPDTKYCEICESCAWLPHLDPGKWSCAQCGHILSLNDKGLATQPAQTTPE
jgi:hypothetical protein